MAKLWRRSGNRRAFHLIAVVLLVVALVWTQAGLALWATAMLVAWALWPGTPARSRLAAAGAVFLARRLALSCFCCFTVAGRLAPDKPIDIAAHAVYPYQLFSSVWGFGISTPDWKGDLPLQLGLGCVGAGYGDGHSGRWRLPHTRGTVTWLDASQAFAVHARLQPGCWPDPHPVNNHVGPSALARFAHAGQHPYLSLATFCPCRAVAGNSRRRRAPGGAPAGPAADVGRARGLRRTQQHRLPFAALHPSRSIHSASYCFR